MARTAVSSRASVPPLIARIIPRFVVHAAGRASALVLVLISQRMTPAAAERLSYKCEFAGLTSALA